ncbi:MAG: hypothetical protein K9N46_00290 [Candidatus Marinimicrobia bacterium]|nr:hypothetical protein [Candidatus Neomarinimicrobiota bacterium]MCF7829879.1 hypothetical protein [Candidatus Neomarinimicrobiota bacterium]MCF7879158.1 hypothetical protein [Candidatus Neomarinimicrobiota bacterium]
MKLPYQFSTDIQPVEPYDFRLLLRDIDQYPLDVTERIAEDKLIRGFSTDSGPVQAAISENVGETLTIDIYSKESVSESLIARQIRHILNLDLDLEGWYDTVSADDPMQKIIQEFRGAKPIAKPSVFEGMATAILEQQLNVTFACTLETRLIKKYGTEICSDAGTSWLFPTPEQMAALDYEELRPLQISGSKSRYIIDIARQITAGEIDPESWHSLEDDEIMERLLAIRGIGQWTAEYVMLIGYRRFDHAPSADIGLRNAVTQLTGSEEQLSEKATREYMDRFAGYRGLATTYIWNAFSAGLLETSRSSP